MMLRENRLIPSYKNLTPQTPNIPHTDHTLWGKVSIRVAGCVLSARRGWCSNEYKMVPDCKVVAI